MKSIYPLVFLLFFGFGIPSASAQVYKFKATSYSVMEKDAKGNWKKWAPFQESTVAITLDGKKDRIIVYSADLQLFKIVAYGEKVSTEFDDTVTFECRDNDGENCNIKIVTRKNQGNRKQIYINYRYIKFVYNIYVTL